MYTHENWRKLKAELGLKNKDIADMLGLTLDSVKNQTQPNKELPTWARGMLWVYDKLKDNPESDSYTLVKKGGLEFEKAMYNKSSTDKYALKVVSSDSEKYCGCYLDNGILKRGNELPKCKLTKEEHKF